MFFYFFFFPFLFSFFLFIFFTRVLKNLIFLASIAARFLVTSLLKKHFLSRFGEHSLEASFSVFLSLIFFSFLFFVPGCNT